MLAHLRLLVLILTLAPVLAPPQTIAKDSAATAAPDMALWGVESRTLQCGGKTREYYVHTPKKYSGSKPVPLVLCFHGGGGVAMKNNKLTHFNETSDAHNFIVVYPQGVDKHWNDGREISGQDVDDLSFVKALIEQLATDYKIDRTRIYCTGISNGGFFSQYLALKIPEKIAALVSVAASMSDKMAAMKKPSRPVPVMYILGTGDPLVQFNGGEIEILGVKRGIAVPCSQAVQFWLEADGCSADGVTTKLDDVAPNDGTHVEKTEYAHCKAGSEVVLLTVQGGGHTWPSGWQYLPEQLIGRTTRDIDNEVIWNFMAKHHR